MADTETRVVEMRFDSRDFDPKIAKSQKTLEDFKKELNFEETSRGLKEFTSNLNGINFSGLASNIEKLTDKFTGLGDAGEWVMSRIRAGIEGAMLQTEQFIKSFTTAQISVGQGKYDALNKAVQSLIATGEYTEEQAYSVFERVMEYTDQTSANFQTMVDQIASFVATGQGLQSSEKAMEGIFNMTAKAGKGATEASSAMMVFSKAMGQGYLSLQNFQSLNQTAHIVTADFRKQILEAAVATGDLVKQGDKYYVAQKYRNQQTEKQTKKTTKEKEKAAQKEQETLNKYEVTADNLETTLSKKWLSKGTMMAVFDKYYFAKLTGATEEELESFAGVAYKSAQRALTFADAMNAVKESVSSGWMQSFRLIFGDVTEAMELFTNLCERVIESIYGLQEARNKLLKIWSSSGGRQALIDAVLGDYGKEVETGAYGLLDLFDDVGEIISEGFWNMLRLFANGYEDKLWDKEGFKEAWLGLKLKDISKGIKDFIASVKGFFTEEIKVGNGTTTRLEMIRNIVKGIGAALVLAGDIIAGVMYFVDGLRKQLQPTIDTVRNFFGELGKTLYGTTKETKKNKSIIKFFGDLLVSLKPLTATINSMTEKLSNLLLTFIKWGIESGFFAKVFQKLKEVFVKFNGILTRVAGPMITFLADLFVIFKELFESGFDPKSVEQVGTKVKAALSKMFAAMLGVESLDKAGEKLKERFKGIMDDLYKNAPDWVKKVVNAIRDLFGLWDNEEDGNSKSVFTKIRKFFEGGFSSIGDFLNQLFGSFKEYSFYDLLKSNFMFPLAYQFLNEIANWFKGTNLYGVIMAFLGVATLWNLFRLIGRIKNIGKDLQWAVEEIASSFKSGFKVRFDDYGDYLLKMAEGIAIFVGCVWLLGSMKLGNVVQGVVALALVMGAVLLFNKLLKKEFANDDGGNQFAYAAKLVSLGIAITGIVAAVALLSLALVPLGKLSLGGWIQSMLGLIIILGTLTAFAYGIKKLKLSSVELAGLLSVTFAVSILVLSIIPFALMKWEAFARALLGLVAVLSVLTLFAFGLKALKLSSAELKGVVCLAAAVLIMVIGIVPFALMTWAAFARSLVGLLGVLTILTLFAYGVKKIKLSTVQLKGVIALAFAIDLLVIGIVPFALMTWAAFARSLLGLVAVLAALTLFAYGLKKLDLNSSRLKGLFALSAAILILVVSIIPFALMNWAAWTRSILGLVLILGALTLFALGLSKLDLSTTKLTGLLGLAIAIGIISLTLTPLSTMDWGGWGRAVLGLVVILGALLLFSLGVSKLEANTVKLVGLVGVAFAIQILCEALKPLSEMSWEGWAKAMAGLLVILGLMFAFTMGMKLADVKASVGALVAMLGLAIVIVAISFALNEIKNVNVNLIQTFTIGLTAMIIAVAAAILVLSAIPLTAGLKAILLLGVGIIAVAAILAVAIPLLLDTIGDSMAEFSAKLLLISDIVQQFSTNMNGVDDSGIDKASDIFDKLKKLMIGISVFGDYSSPISSFTTALYDLGTGLYIYNEYTKAIPSPENSPAFKMVDEIVKMSGTLSSFSIGNFTDEVYGLAVGLYAFDYLGSDMGNAQESKPLLLLKELAGCATDLQTLSTIGLDTLKGQLAGLGGAMMLYAEGAQEITGVGGDQSTNVESAMSILRAITQAFVDDGGFTLPTIPTEAELGSFGADLAALAGAIVKFANASNELGEGTDKALAVLTFMSDLKTKLTKENLETAGAFIEAGVSGDVMTSFSTDIIALSGALKNFIDNTKDIDDSKIKSATGALSFFSELKSQLIAQDAVLAVINWFSGDTINENQLETFGKNIEQLGLALKSFATSVNLDEKTQGNFTTALEALGFLSELEKKLPKVGGVVALFTGTQQTLTDLAAQVVLLGEAISTFNSAITDENGESKLNDTAMSSALDILNKVVSLLGRLKTEMGPVGGFLSFFTGKSYDASNLKDDIESFKGVIGELVGISALLNGEDNTNPVPDSEKLNSAISVITQITGFITNLGKEMPKSRPLLEVFTGEVYNTSKLKEDMTNFGAVIKELVSVTKTLNGDDKTAPMLDQALIEPSLAAIDLVLGFVTSLGEKMPRDNTFLDDFFTGEKYSTDKLVTDITNFKSVIAELVNISTLLNGNDKSNPLPKKEDIDTAVSAIDPITTFVKDLGEKMPHDETFLSVFTGKKYNLDKLKTDISEFGKVCDELSTVADKLSGKGTEAITIDQESIDVATTSVDSILEFSKSLGTKMPEVGGLTQTISSWFNGGTFSLANLQTELKNFGDCAKELVSISSTLSGENGKDPIVTDDKVKSATAVIDSILEFSNSLSEKAPKVGGIDKFLNNFLHGSDYNFQNLKEDLIALGEGFGGFTAGIGTDFDPDKAVAAIDVAAGITETLNTLSMLGSDDYDTIDRNMGSIFTYLDAMNNGYKGYTSGRYQELPPMIKVITDLAKAISDSIDLAGGIKLDNIKIFEQMALGLQRLSKIDPEFNFEPVGTSIAEGIANGIKNGETIVTQTARDLAIATYKATMKALDANSPSKLFMDVGEFVTAGMAIGIDDGTTDVKKSIVNMSGETLESATSVLGIISQLLGEELEANPTISPVLDLTDLSNGIVLMNDMLEGNGMSISTRTAAGLASANIPHSASAETNQNGTDFSGIYERMAALGEQIAQMGDQITKMKIVLDTGAIAGAVTDQVDANIGAKAFYAGRGN